MHYFRFAIALAIGGLTAGAQDPAASVEEIDYGIQLDTVIQEYDGTFSWFHPRSASIPGAGKDGAPAVVITMQKWFSSASDFFSGLSVLRSDDMGTTWTGPEERPELAWREEENGVTVGVCDMTPGYHPATGKVLGIGHTVRYVNDKLMPDPRPRETAYTVYDPATLGWTDWRTLDMPDEARFFSSGSACGQWLNQADGTVLAPFYFKAADAKTYASAVMRCAFDGTTLSVIEIGEPIEHDVVRGVYEPSLARYKDKIYLTLRNDDRAYVAVSDDGLRFGPKQPWLFDDGEELGSYNTQQHWATHKGGLFLVYTRRGADNDHIVRNRAPLFVAQVDPEHLRVIRATERVAVPERGAMLGNFGVTQITPDETWITVGEGMYKPEQALARGANGRVYAARIK
ncbi:MAG: glycoside hydrolase [Candidatus Hydrogenedentes bacterium]|nr:glycoside hydrolase [Candidatus Hydrogenedentota bacterium]